MLARMDEWGKATWLVLTVVAFWFAWPLGLALLAFLAGSGRLQAWRDETAGLRGRWFNLRDAGEGFRAGGRGGASAQGGGASPTQGGGRFTWPGCSSTSGNTAFDTYRAAELERLEQEQRQFKEFIDRLRQARDKAEFDQFMADRRRRTEGTGPIVETGAAQRDA